MRINEQIMPFELIYCNDSNSHAIFLDKDNFTHRNIESGDIKRLSELFLVGFYKDILDELTFDSNDNKFEIFRVYGKKEKLIEFIKMFKIIWDNDELFNKLMLSYQYISDIEDSIFDTRKGLS